MLAACHTSNSRPCAFPPFPFLSFFFPSNGDDLLNALVKMEIMLIKTVHCFCRSLLRLRVFKELLKGLAVHFSFCIRMKGRLETGPALYTFCLAMRIVVLYATRSAIVGLINYCFVIRCFRTRTHYFFLVRIR